MKSDTTSDADKRAELRDAKAALAALEAKLGAAGGIQQVVEKLDAAGKAVASVSEAEIAETREQIRELIDRLMAMHGDLQGLAALRRTLE